MLSSLPPNIFKIFLGKTFDESGELIISSQICTFVLSAGEFGGKRTSKVLVPLLDEPSRSPDSSVKEKTSVNQVIIFI
jgi:3-hydroxyacyl-CoA dehydrogenase/3a,7a,12a-trihydroxy-5b-cholest-24-enoyl-CoA hydratase